MFTILAAAEPAGGAALDQVAIATGGASVVTAALLWLVSRHRSGRSTILGRAAALTERVSGLPGWAALPSFLAAIALLVALLGMYWDIALHIGEGRDEGPLANPAHYLILAGLFGIFAAGVVAMALPVGERPGPAPVRIAHGWHAPVGGILMAACGAFALTGFPLDDVWHRLFGQDVTLWGPTHLMLIGGAGMSLIGQAVLLQEGMAARRAAGGPGAARSMPLVTALRRVALMGGLLIGLSTFQAEFDFGVPQFRQVFHPMLIAVAGAAALVAARLWIGRGGALGAVAFFLVVRGLISLIVGPVLGEPTPYLPLYLGAALSVELAALVVGRRPLALGALGGLLVGTVGTAVEWAWTQLAMPLPWTSALLPEAAIVAPLAGLAGGIAGALLGAGLRGELPRPAVARPLALASLVAIAALVANGLATDQPRDLRATVALEQTRSGPEREAHALVRLDPPSAGRDAEWLTMTAWQGGGLHLDRLERVGPGTWRTTEPVPLHEDWKAIVRLQRGRAIVGLPVYLPRDEAIPAPQVPAPARFERAFVPDVQILQRERREASAWLWSAAGLTVLAIALAFLAALAWGVERVGRGRVAEGPSRREPPRRPAARPPVPAGA